MAQVQERPVIQVPAQGSDRPVWARVGVIAVVGFALGIAWPRLAGVRLGPAPPEEGKPNAALSGSASSARAELSGSLSQTAPLAASVPASSAGSGMPIAISPGKVTSCRNAKGKTVEDCDNPDFQSVANPKFKALSKCPAAAGQSGKLSIGFDLDFNRNRIKLIRGKSTTLPLPAANALWQCLETEFQKARLDEVTHQHTRYTIFYTVQFLLAGKAPEIEVAPEKTDSGDQEEKKPTDPTLGSAQVVYDTVLVRDEPKEGKVVARLVRGTRVELLSRKGGWYKIRFGDREGWVYRGSVAQ